MAKLEDYQPMDDGDILGLRLNIKSAVIIMTANYLENARSAEYYNAEKPKPSSGNGKYVNQDVWAGAVNVCNAA